MELVSAVEFLALIAHTVARTHTVSANIVRHPLLVREHVQRIEPVKLSAIPTKPPLGEHRLGHSLHDLDVVLQAVVDVELDLLDLLQRHATRLYGPGPTLHRLVEIQPIVVVARRESAELLTQRIQESLETLYLTTNPAPITGARIAMPYESAYIDRHLILLLR